jgi:hypothetical protein
MDLDEGLRHHIYATATRRGTPPTIAELAEISDVAASSVRASLDRLAAGRVVVLQAGSGEILMAPPFSAVPTPFVVKTDAHSSFANCAWDAIGVPIMLNQPAHIVSSCGCCGAAITLDVTPDAPPHPGPLMHFAIPAARWWQDLVYT